MTTILVLFLATVVIAISLGKMIRADGLGTRRPPRSHHGSLPQSSGWPHQN